MSDRLDDERRAIGARIERERRSYDPTAARRASGARMEQERRGAAVQDDINSLVRPERKRQALPPIVPRGALPAQRGRADYKAPAAGTGGGLASPATESAGSREYATDFTFVETIDGSGYFRVRAAKKLTLIDAENREIIVNLDA
ncbi:MAG: hypothetical protein Q8R10_19635 [Pseudomonas sp.]|uniref:hypothetical protein n=1 Tax=Pseudomonas sp. TaxID=306 RepID=UPI002735A5DF|nr:hypothetical protein [Pseudomonas sp.]MDP3848637.1 hypothetical protein [Pseudomonas sp.]